MTAVFIGRCDDLGAKDLGDFDDSSRDIGNRTFRKHIGREQYAAFERSQGYGRDCGLVLSADWHVSYKKGKWKGRPAVCCMWSAYHHIWVLKGETR